LPFHNHPILGSPEVDPDVLRRMLPDRQIPAPPPPSLPIRRLVWELAVMMCALLSATSKSAQKPLMISHENLCADPQERFKVLYSQLGLTWTAAAARYVQASDVAGVGAYDTKRIAQMEPSRWREQLSDADVEDINEVVANFGIPWTE
jgi:hypothetical protein